MLSINIILSIILGCNATGSAWYWSEYNMCTCKANIVGDRCDKCSKGFSGFPSCIAGKFFHEIVQVQSGIHLLVKCKQDSVRKSSSLQQ